MKNRLRELRKARGLTGEQVAELASVDQSTVTRAEIRDLLPKAVRKICRALGISPLEAILPEDQYRLIQAFERIPEKNRQTALDTLLLMCSRWQNDDAA